MLTTEMRGEDDRRGGGRGSGVVGAEEGGDVHGGCGLDRDVGCVSCLSYTRRRCARSSDHRHELYFILLFILLLYVETLQHIPLGRHGGSTTRYSLECAAPISQRYLCLSPALYDGLKVLDPLQSCNNRRASHRRDAFGGCQY
jgi:hypothetical protein